MWTKFPRLTQPNFWKAYQAVRDRNRETALTAKECAETFGVATTTAANALHILEARELVMSERRPDAPNGTKYYWGNEFVAPYADIIFDLDCINEQERRLRQ